METFDVSIQKDNTGRMTFFEIPFDAREKFCKPKGTLYVSGTINGIAFRSKLLSRGSGKFLMVIDKRLQKSIGFNGQAMDAHITMLSEDMEQVGEKQKEPIVESRIDVLTAIKTRQSIRKFTSKPVDDDMITTILCCGMYAPTAQNKRPCHFIVVRNRQLLTALATQNIHASMLADAAGAIIICGDKNVEGTKEFLYADCTAATQNILLGIHGLGLGGVWCGVASNSDWRKMMITTLELPPKMELFAVIAYGWPDEEKELCHRFESRKIHYDKW